MKKLIVITALAPLIITAAVIQFLPEKVPMHYDIHDNADRYGSRYEMFILPLCLLIITAVFMMISHRFSVKGRNGESKQNAEACSNARVTDILTLALSVMLGVMQYFFLYRVMVNSGGSAADAEFDSLKLSAVLLSLLLIVAGNIMPKTGSNHTVGLRIKWSLYNDTTWTKSNRFAGHVLAASGVLSLLTSLLCKSGAAATVMLLVYLTAAIVVSSAYAKKVYDEETAKAQ